MIVRQFLKWVQTAPAGERAEATSALARAYLHSDLEPADRKAAEAAMTVLLDDPSPLVREALASVLGASPQAPSAIIHALANDQIEVAALVLTTSPILSDAELIEVIGAGDWRAQCAVACRLTISATLAGALAEIGGADACLALVQNGGADLSPDLLTRICERHGDDGELRAELLAREDLPPAARQAAVAALSGSLCSFVTERGWLGDERARRVASEARDKATIAIAGRGADDEMRGLVRHLRSSRQLTAALVLRALLSGNVRLFEEALSELSGMPVARVSGIVHARLSAGFDVLYDKAGLPPRARPAFRAALSALAEDRFGQDHGSDARLSRRMIERVLTTVGTLGDADAGQILLMLRRFAAEAARDEARDIADDMIKDLMIAA